jgi:molybdenum cofactor biosynthesis enzyme MoaA
VDHCYFRKQPESPDEVERVIKAVAGCCCGSYRYAGDDPEIKKRLRLAGCAEAIDHRQ